MTTMNRKGLVFLIEENKLRIKQLYYRINNKLNASAQNICDLLNKNLEIININAGWPRPKIIRKLKRR